MHLLASVFDHPSWRGAAVIAAKTAAIYVFLVVSLRLFGKRQLGQISLYDLVLVIILGNAVQNAMINNDNTLGGGLVAATVLLGLNWILNKVHPALQARRAISSSASPSLIVHDGQLLREHMARQGITTDEVRPRCGSTASTRSKDVQLAVLESDGTISVVPSGSEILKTRRHYRGLRLQ